MKKTNLFNQSIFFLTSLFLLLFIPYSIEAQETTDKVEATIDEDASIFNTLIREDILKLNLKAPLHTLMKKRKDEEKYPATLSYTDENGKAVEQAIKVRTRGNMRKEICYTPPIKIYFPKKQLTADGFNKKFNDYKLVVKCKKYDTYNDYVLKEYLAYKLYSALTDYSFRVQLIELTIEDTDGKKDPLETYGFIIENQDELAHRLRGEIIKPKILSPRAIEPAFYDKMTVFQYMIGNTDWYMYNQHNLKVFKNDEYSWPITIPYDFDYAGMVNTNYAVPHEKLPIGSVRNRYFLGRCRDDGDYEATLQLFRDKKSELLAIVNDFAYLESDSKERLLKYLEDFFEVLDNPKATRKRIVEHCGMHVKVDG